MDIPIGVAKNVVIPNLAKFLNEYPNIEIELSTIGRRVDIIAAGFDCVLRIGASSDSGLIAKSLGQLKMINCVSPSYIKAHKDLTKIEELDK